MKIDSSHLLYSGLLKKFWVLVCCLTPTFFYVLGLGFYLVFRLVLGMYIPNAYIVYALGVTVLSQSLGLG